MYRPESPSRPPPSALPAGYQPRVVVKFRETPSALVAGMTSTGRAPAPGPREQADVLRQRFPGAVVERLFSSTPPARLQALVRDARRESPPGRTASPTSTPSTACAWAPGRTPARRSAWRPTCPAWSARTGRARPPRRRWTPPTIPAPRTSDT